eukprot:TRINITY_DN8433_c0_g1_i1.p1 TRINITY_DN8433_c0_g1~~TRINITY_DN8433_c0_g1_i1.p1  ORF type:complete len:168 (-),score=53.90 TRINITY_DN8433_c0_g1_i1:102-605(-)
MFFKISLEKQVAIAPQFFGPNFLNKVKDELRGNVIGKFLPKQGFVIAVMNIVNKDKPLLQEGTGNALIDIVFDAIVIHPFSQQVIEAVVTNITKEKIELKAGPLVIAIHHSNTGSFKFDESQKNYSYENQIIEPGSLLRVRLKGISCESTFFAIAEIDDKSTGLRSC